MTIIYWVKVILDIPKLSLIKNTDDLLSSETLLMLKRTVLIRQNDRLVIFNIRGKFGLENVHAVDIDQSERFLRLKTRRM